MVSLRSSKRKQQTRLNFTPLPSSSPTPSDLPELIPTKAANVRYDPMASPTKKRRLRLEDASTLPSSRRLNFEVTALAAKGSGQEMGLPTPEPSSQMEAKQDHEAVSESDSSDSLMNELGTSARKPRGGLRADNEEDDDLSDADPVTPRRGRRLLRKNLSSPVALEGSRTGRTPANPPNKARSTRQKQLELLRRRRAGTNQQPASDDELDIEAPPEGSYKDSTLLGELDEDSDSNPALLQDVNPANLDEYEQDFLDDEEDPDTLGAPPDLSSIPLEFTRHAHKKPIEHFKDVVEWMVHNKLNPAFARNDPVYAISRRKLDDVVQGFAGSKFISSAWRPEFSAALKKYPDVGKPYDRESLEDLSSSDDSGSEETELPTSQAFFLGRTCNANAETAHALHHWRHQLNTFVLDLLRADGHTDPHKIVEREGWSVKKRERYANEVVDGWEREGRVRELYREFKENIEVARDVKVCLLFSCLFGCFLVFLWCFYGVFMVFLWCFFVWGREGRRKCHVPERFKSEGLTRQFFHPQNETFSYGR
ncbi:MAG: hypothetical protein Q9173_006605 [Seirophora scorigena]